MTPYPIDLLRIGAHVCVGLVVVCVGLAVIEIVRDQGRTRGWW